jgi:hypothetical protein
MHSVDFNNIPRKPRRPVKRKGEALSLYRQPAGEPLDDWRPMRGKGPQSFESVLRLRIP